MDKAVKGFTLIELVVVITILGILAAFAFPRFAALEVEARAATVEGLGGSVRSAAALAHSMALATAAASNGTIVMEGNNIGLANHYPATNDINLALMDYTGFSYAAGVFTKDGANNPANCSVTYVAPAAPNNAPTVTVDTSIC